MRKIVEIFEEILNAWMFLGLYVNVGEWWRYEIMVEVGGVLGKVLGLLGEMGDRLC